MVTLCTCASPRSTRPLSRARLAFAASCLVAMTLASMDATCGDAGPAAASAPTGSASAAKWAQRETDMVFRWILVQRENPKRWSSDAPASAAAASGAASRSPAPMHVPPATAVATAPAPPLAAARPTAPKASAAVARTSAAVERPRAPEAAKIPPSAKDALATASSDAEAAPPDVLSEPAQVAHGGLAPSAVAASTSLQDSQPEGQEDLPLVIRVQVDPKFSPRVLAHLGKGKVEVHFEVAPDGSVSQATVSESSHARLNGPVLHAVTQWKFEPLHHAQPGAAVLAFDVEQP